MSKIGYSDSTNFVIQPNTYDIIICSSQTTLITLPPLLSQTKNIQIVNNTESNVVILDPTSGFADTLIPITNIVLLPTIQLNVWTVASASSTDSSRNMYSLIPELLGATSNTGWNVTASATATGSFAYAPFEVLELNSSINNNWAPVNAVGDSIKLENSGLISISPTTTIINLRPGSPNLNGFKLEGIDGATTITLYTSTTVHAAGVPVSYSFVNIAFFKTFVWTFTFADATNAGIASLQLLG